MKISTTKNSYLTRIIVVLAWIFIWQILSMIVNKEILLASPISTFLAFIELIQTKEFYVAIFNTSYKILLGFSSSLIVALFMALLSSKSILIKEFIKPINFLAKTIPVASFVILCLIWVSSENLSIVISFIMTFPIIYTNTLNAIENINSDVRNFVKVYKISVFRQIRYIYISEIMEIIKSSINVCIGLAFKAGIAAEVIGIPINSIGENLYKSKIYLDTQNLFAWTIAIIMVSMVIEKIIMALIEFFVGRLELR